jgi:hypothetical protein
VRLHAQGTKAPDSNINLRIYLELRSSAAFGTVALLETRAVRQSIDPDSRSRDGAWNPPRIEYFEENNAGIGCSTRGGSLLFFRQDEIRMLVYLPVLFLPPLFRHFTELCRSPRSLRSAR